MTEEVKNAALTRVDTTIKNMCKSIDTTMGASQDLERSEQLGAFMNILANEISTLSRDIKDAPLQDTLTTFHEALSMLSSYQLELSAKMGELIHINKEMGAVNQELTKREMIWKSLLSTTDKMASSPTSRMEEIRQIASTIRRMSEAYGITIFIIQEGTLTPIIQDGYGGKVRQNANRWASPSKEIEWIEDVRADAKFDEVDTSIITKVEFPLIADDTVSGILELSFGKQIPRDEHLIETLIPAAGSIASFMSSLNMNRETRHSYQYLIYKFQEVAGIYHHETVEHLERVSKYCVLAAQWLGKGEQDQDDIALFSKVHDLGKIRVPATITDKPAPLTKEEFDIMKKHTIWGADLIGNTKWLKMARNVCLYHHERYDGTGYPFSMKGARIPWEAQVVSIMDIYDALRSRRAYKSGFSHEDTIKILLEGDGRVMPSHFDPKLLDFLKEQHQALDVIFTQSLEYSGL